MYIPLTFEGSQAKCLFATGGVEGFFISGSQQYKYHWFTGSANLEVQKGTIDNVQILVVGGGGGGARGARAGGGGGGGVNFNSNGRLFQGTYNVSVGAGGNGGSGSNAAVGGGSSSFIGSNLSMIASGGEGGSNAFPGNGGASGNPTSFAGGSNTGTLGGGGGGASSTGSNATTSPAAYGIGGAGLTFAIANYVGSFGCGGGGGGGGTGQIAGAAGCESSGRGGGISITNGAQSGSNRYGGGGGGAYNSATFVGGDGGSGSVVIQYPIYDYCTNFFNETGSCGCRELTFDTSDLGGWYPNVTGSYLYMPCGGDRFVSGSLIAYAPLTVCAVSNSYYSYTNGDPVEPIVITVTAGFINSGKECVSASLAPIACSTEAFVPTCTSSIVNIYTPSASVGTPNTFGYVAKNETTHSLYTATSARVKYICMSTGSLYAGNQIYPQVLTGNYVTLYNTVSCNTITLVADWAGLPGSFSSFATYTYYECNGEKTSLTFNRPSSNYRGALSASVCRDMNTSASVSYGGTSQPTFYIYTGGDCLSGSFDTGSCGCP